MTQKIHLKAFLVSDRSDSYQINALKQLLNPDRLHIYGQVILGKAAQYPMLLLLSHFSCVPTLCNPIDGSPPGFPVPGILQARTLEWVAISFSNAWKWKVKVKSLSRVWPSVTPWTAALQAPPSMGFSRQEYWSGVPLPSPQYSVGTIFSTNGAGKTGCLNVSSKIRLLLMPYIILYLFNC